MWILDPIFRLLASTFKNIIKFAVIYFEILERVLSKFLTLADWDLYNAVDEGGASDAEKRKVENGNGADIVNDENPPPPTPTPTNPGTRIKRIKLLVDINISPGGSSKVVNVATTDVMDETPPSAPPKFFQFISKYSLYVLYVSRTIKQALIESITPRISRHDTVHKDGRRRTISPRRRMSQVKRLVPHFPFRLLGIPEPMTDSVIIVPQLKNGETDRFARAQSLEKRKRPDSTSSSDSLYDADECRGVFFPPSPPVIKINGDVEKENSDAPIINGVAENGEKEEELLSDPPIIGSDSAGSSQDQYGSPSSTLFKMLNIPEEEYASAEDPDYEPDLSSSSSSQEESSNSDSESSGRKNLELEQEILDLQAEARAILVNQELEAIDNRLELQNNPAAEVDQVAERVDDAEVQNNAEIAPPNFVEEDLNEPEYSNGQASMRELFARPVPPPVEGVANRRPNNSDDNK